MEHRTEYLLTNESVDVISEQVSVFLKQLNMEPKNCLRLRFLVEEILLDWQAHFSDQVNCRVRIGKRFQQPFIHLEIDQKYLHNFQRTSMCLEFCRQSRFHTPKLRPLHKL